MIKEPDGKGADIYQYRISMPRKKRRDNQGAKDNTPHAYYKSSPSKRGKGIK